MVLSRELGAASGGLVVVIHSIPVAMIRPDFPAKCHCYAIAGLIFMGCVHPGVSGGDRGPLWGTDLDGFRVRYYCSAPIPSFSAA